MRFIKWLYSSRTGRFLLAFAAFLIVARVLLPLGVLWYVNNTLDSIPGYRGHIQDIDLSLWRGAYQIKGISLYQKGKRISKPLFAARKVDLSVYWGALFNGQIVTKIRLYHPEVNFVAAPPGGKAQTGASVPVAKVVRQLVPFNIARFSVFDGAAHYYDFHSKPKVNITADHIHVIARNLTNNKHISGSLVSTVKGDARVMRTAHAYLDLKINPFAKKPEFNLHFRLLHLEMSRLQDLFKAYLPVTIHKGKLDVVTEMAAHNGQLTGYVKPLMRNLDIFSLKGNDQPLHLLKQAAAAGTVQLLKNHSKNQFATRIPISGSLNDPNVAILPLIGNILKNGFIKAFQPVYEKNVHLPQPGQPSPQPKQKHQSIWNKIRNAMPF